MRSLETSLQGASSIRRSVTVTGRSPGGLRRVGRALDSSDARGDAQPRQMRAWGGKEFSDTSMATAMADERVRGVSQLYLS